MKHVIEFQIGPFYFYIFCLEFGSLNKRNSIPLNNWRIIASVTQNELRF
jgi:hypothetical protein